MPFLFPNQFDIKSHPIAETLIHWYSGAKRDLPWRETKDPYKVWVSEIILQQTRVDQGLPYYYRFVDSFPTIKDLANAPEVEVLANWQGLGYYSRARNMHATAKYVSNELKGQFPRTYDSILELKGVGPYTAAAISSICFDEPEPVVDGNVFRVTSRLFGISDDIMEAKTRKKFVSILKEIIPHSDPGTFNQAMMEYGATVCTPSPNCDRCVLTKECLALEMNRVKDFPVKLKKTKVRKRDLNYLVLAHDGNILMRKRTAKDIWQGLFDFPESTDHESEDFSEPITHLLSHQRLSVRFAYREVKKDQFEEFARMYDSHPYSLEQIVTLPKPKVIVDFINKAFS